MKQIVWLMMWAAGTTPKNARKVQPLLHAPRNKMTSLPIADEDGFGGLRTTTPIVSVCSASQPKTFCMPFLCFRAMSINRPRDKAP